MVKSNKDLNNFIHNLHPFLAEDWHRKGVTYIRQSGEWIQHLRFIRRHQTTTIQTDFDFLYLPNSSGSGVLLQILSSPGSDAKISLRDWEIRKRSDFIKNEIFSQFKPNMRHPLTQINVYQLVEKESHYWVHAYASCINALLHQDINQADIFYRAFERTIGPPIYDWIPPYIEELKLCMTLGHDPDALRQHLEAIREQNQSPKRNS